ncbi:MFS transporter, partial [Myroides pelagicus]|uniref:MFS transporter n=1 Tax=Myroides pelagicus TaxID=270914 RepID=UPI002DBDAB01
TNKKGQIDYSGTLLLSLGLVSFIYPLTTPVERGIDYQLILCLLAAMVLLYGFVRVEKNRKRRGDSTLVDFDVFKYKNLTLGIVISFLFYTSGVFYLVFGIYLQEGLHWSSMQAGKAIIPFGIGFIVLSLCSSVLSRYIKQRILSLGILVYGIGFILLGYTLYHFNVLFFKLSLFVIGSGMGLTLASVVRLSLSGIPVCFAGLASGLV